MVKFCHHHYQRLLWPWPWWCWLWLHWALSSNQFSAFSNSLAINIISPPLHYIGCILRAEKVIIDVIYERIWQFVSTSQDIFFWGRNESDSPRKIINPPSERLCFQFIIHPTIICLDRSTARQVIYQNFLFLKTNIQEE